MTKVQPRFRVRLRPTVEPTGADVVVYVHMYIRMYTRQSQECNESGARSVGTLKVRQPLYVLDPQWRSSRVRGKEAMTSRTRCRLSRSPLSLSGLQLTLPAQGSMQATQQTVCWAGRRAERDWRGRAHTVQTALRRRSPKTDKLKGTHKRPLDGGLCIGTWLRLVWATVWGSMFLVRCMEPWNSTMTFDGGSVAAIRFGRRKA